jgi:hypothetical protein
MALRTFSRVFILTCEGLLRTRETVATETLAFRATSRIVLRASAFIFFVTVYNLALKKNAVKEKLQVLGRRCDRDGLTTEEIARRTAFKMNPSLPVFLREADWGGGLWDL